MSLFKLGTVDLTYVKVKINISMQHTEQPECEIVAF